MRTFFYRNGCTPCHMTKFGILMANLRLPVGKMINWVEIMSGDTRTNVIREEFGELFAPVVVIDEMSPHKFGDNYVKGYSRNMFISTFGSNTYDTMIKNILYDEVI